VIDHQNLARAFGRDQFQPELFLERGENQRAGIRRIVRFSTLPIAHQFEKGSYSYRNATMGSTEDARRAGINAAKAAVTINTRVTAAKISGF
jgi:hypothetical protein